MKGSEGLTAMIFGALGVAINILIYQLKSGKRFNALKYLNIYHRFDNIRKGEENGKFLGL